MMTAPKTAPDWKRAGNAIAARRGELGFKTQEAAADASDMGVQTYRLIEQGKNATPKASTLAQIERAFGWPIGSIRAIAEGGPAPASDPRVAVVEEDVSLLKAEMAELRTMIEELRRFLMRDDGGLRG